MEISTPYIHRERDGCTFECTDGWMDDDDDDDR